MYDLKIKNKRSHRSHTLQLIRELAPSLQLWVCSKVLVCRLLLLEQDIWSLSLLSCPCPPFCQHDWQVWSQRRIQNGSRPNANHQPLCSLFTPFIPEFQSTVQMLTCPQTPQEKQVGSICYYHLLFYRNKSGSEPWTVLLRDSWWIIVCPGDLHLVINYIMLPLKDHKYLPFNW